MPCKNCGNALEMTANEGGVQTGQFLEQYKCCVCGARGTITGKAEDPAHKWDRRGAALE